MAERVDLAEVACGDEGRTARLAAAEHLERRIGVDLLLIGRGVATVRHVVNLVEAVREEVVLIAETLREHAKELAAQQTLVNTVKVIEARERAPAKEHRGKHVLLGPIHDAAKLVPIVDALERHLLDGGARDDEAVIIVGLELVERVVELHEMVRRVRGLVARDAHEIDAHLDG